MNGLKCQGQRKFARVDITFQTVITFQTEIILLNISFILISVKTKVPLLIHTKFQLIIPSHFGKMDLNVRVHINFFRVDVNM